jgi:adenine phosphoribosyltransferase|tara:strand:+ start:552 stop:1067 length:516 start_codon:yes stop_codon:yes gene_type:complete
VNLKSVIRDFPDFPQKGIIFRDITPILRDPQIFQEIVSGLMSNHKQNDIDLIAGIESRGFLFGIAVSHALAKGFVPIRKQGKLPGDTISVDYTIEYGTATMEVQKDAINPGDRVLIVDDLLATGGTANAAAQLVERIHGKVVGISFVVELLALQGREKLKDYDVTSLVVYE